MCLVGQHLIREFSDCLPELLDLLLHLPVLLRQQTHLSHGRLQGVHVYSTLEDLMHMTSILQRRLNIMLVCMLGS